MNFLFCRLLDVGPSLSFLAPAIERGRFMLAIRYRYWAKFKDSQRVIPITRKEALGNSAFEFGDLFQIDTNEDYNVVSHSLEKERIRIFLEAKIKTSVLQAC
jgi:hypothetical protein